MAPYNPMKKHMDKIDEWGAAQAKKISAQRSAAPGVSMSERLNMARGKDTRWESGRASTAQEGEEDASNIVPNRTARVGHLPPAPPGSLNRSQVRAPPPPPQRNSGSSSAASIPAPPARSPAAGASRPPPPVLPRRMDNENGTANPPPPYPASAPAPPARRDTSNSSLSNESGPAHFEFSQFGAEDKEAFFTMLDEYFAARMNPTGKSSRRSAPASNTNPAPAADTPSSTFAVAKAAVAATAVTSKREPPPKPSGPGAKASVHANTQANSLSETASSSLSPSTSASKPAASASSAPTWQYPRLTASAHPVTELCKALTCSSFLVYRDSYPEWSGAQPWFTKPNAIPSSLQGRRDIAWSSSSMYRGDDYTMMGAALFDDLSCLWWRLSWNKSRPAATVQVDAAYREPPPAWADEGRLVEAARGFGDWIAGFAEQSEQNGQPVGDGECWTLAAEAIKYTNDTAQLTADNRLLTSIGRTHGHLIYAAKADPIKGQCGRWRGGDRFRERWGGIRRGDIVEWRTARCSELNGAPGSYFTLGAPDHTAVIIDNSPLPEWIGKTAQQGRGKKAKEDTHYSVLGLKQTATQAEIRSAYLTAARKHHPDRNPSGASASVNGHDDERIQKLNEANETLSDPARRAAYDTALRGGASATQSNANRITATVDLDDMEVVEDGDKLTFYHACRCGSGYYADEDALQGQSRLTVQCSGCSERIRIVTGEGEGAHHDDIDDDEDAQADEEDDQPELQPWELGSITTIEQSAGQVPTRKTYSLARDSFTHGEMWIYRPVWEKELLAGAVQPSWPPNLPGWQPVT